MAKARRARRKENPLLRKVENRQAWVQLAFCQKHNSRVESRPPMSKKRPTEVGATRGGPHHAPRLRPDQCVLCRQVGHCASECPNKGKPACFLTWKTCIWYLCSGLCSVRFPTVEEIEQDQDEEDIEYFVAFLGVFAHVCVASMRGVATSQ